MAGAHRWLRVVEEAPSQRLGRLTEQWFSRPVCRVSILSVSHHLFVTALESNLSSFLPCFGWGLYVHLSMRVCVCVCVCVCVQSCFTQVFSISLSLGHDVITSLWEVCEVRTHLLFLWLYLS